MRLTRSSSSRLLRILVAEMALVHGPVHERDAGRVDHAVIGGLARRGAPFLRVAGHDRDRLLQGAYAHLGDVAHVGELRAHFERRLHDCLRVLTQRKALDAAFHDLERPPRAAERRQLALTLAYGCEVALGAFEREPGAGEAARRQHGRENGVAAGVSGGARLPVGEHVDARLVEREVGRDREVQRVRHALRRQPEQIGRGDAARDAVEGRMVEGRDVHDIAEAAVHLVGEHCRGDARASRRRRPPRPRRARPRCCRWDGPRRGSCSRRCSRDTGSSRRSRKRRGPGSPSGRCR